MIFNVAYKKGDRISIKVTDGQKKEIWMGVSETVYNWCKKSYADGDSVDVTYTVKAGQYTATRVVAKGSNNAPPAEASQERKVTTNTPESKEEVKAPGTEQKKVGNYRYPGEYMKSKNPEESKQIRALSILSSVCSAVQSLAGQVCPNTIGDIVLALYDKCDKKLP